MKNKLNIFWYLLILFFYLEILYKHFAFNALFTLNTIFLIPFTFLIVNILSLIIGLFKSKKIKKIFLFIITIFFSIYYCAQFVYYNFYQAMISLYSLKMGTAQVFGWFDQILLVILRNIIPVLLFLLPIVLLIIYKNKLNYNKNETWRIKVLTLTSIMSLLLSIASIIPINNKIYSNYNLFFNIHYPTLTVNKFGLTTTALIDAYRCITSYQEKYLITEEINKTTYNKKEYNILEIDFNKLIENEKDKNIINLHKYFMNQEPTNKNEYTGIFKDKNLIFINAESFDKIAINKDITPTLYKLYNEGIKFNNYYVPLFPVSTADGEYMNSTSLLPKEGVWSIYETSKNYMPFSIANVFNKLDYNTYAFHNHSHTFFNRDKIYPNLGFDSFLACGNGLEKEINCNLWPESDEELFVKSFEHYKNDNKFLAYFMTVSGHLRYTKNNSIAKKNWNDIKDNNLDESYKAYLSQNIDLDKGLKYIINELEKINKLDNTVIVIAPDHYPYGLSDKELYNIDKTKQGNFNKYLSSLIIWSSDLEHIEVNKTVSSTDIIPTIYNLFGIEYDSRLFIGKDAFSNSESIFIKSDRSFKTDHLEYNALNGTYKFYGTENKTLLNKTINDVYNKYTISNKILELDYYKTLKDLLD